MAAVGEGHETLAHVLLLKGADVHAHDNSGNTALHGVARCTGHWLVYLLLSAGARVDAANHEGSTALHVACKEGNLAVAKCLMRHGASPELANAHGQTPLEVATGDVRDFLATAYRRQPSWYLAKVCTRPSACTSCP